jgi:beta-lactamase superfamily II metal-dependent hydrolase
MNENVSAKNTRKALTVLISISLLVLVALLGVLVWWQSVELTETSITFLDVGQGDAILIQQGKYQVLIDGGKDGKRLTSELGRAVPFWDRKIEVLIPTHPDADHIGGLAGLAKVYDIESVFFNGAVGESEYFVRFEQEVSTRVPKEEWQLLRAGSTFILPQGGKLTVMYPKDTFSGIQPDGKTNEGSIVILFEYEKTSFLLTGDLAYEETVLPKLAPVTILKAAHHGSRFSTSHTFLDMVAPKEAVISVGDNTYGHPTPEVLQRLAEHNVTVFRTDQLGSIKYICSQEHQGCTYER